MAWAREARLPLRVVAILGEGGIADQPGIAVLHDRQGAFAAAYGAQPACFLVRPDGHVGWRGRSCRDAGLLAHLGRFLRLPGAVAAADR